MPELMLPPDLRELLSQSNSNFPSHPVLPGSFYFATVVRTDIVPAKSTDSKAIVHYVQLKELVPGQDFSGLSAEDKKILQTAPVTDYEFPGSVLFGNANVFWVHPNALRGLADFHRSMGFPDSMGMEECVQKTAGRDVLVCIGRDLNNSGERPGRPFNFVHSISGDPRRNKA